MRLLIVLSFFFGALTGVASELNFKKLDSVNKIFSGYLVMKKDKSNMSFSDIMTIPTKAPAGLKKILKGETLSTMAGKFEPNKFNAVWINGMELEVLYFPENQTLTNEGFWYDGKLMIKDTDFKDTSSH